MTNSSRLNRFFLILVIVYIAGSLGIGYMLSGHNISVYLLMLISQLLVLLPTAVYVKNKGQSLKKIIPLKTIPIGAVLCLVGIALLTTPVMMLLNLVSSYFAGNETEELLMSIKDRPFILNLLFIAVLPAVSEEFICRGVFYRGLRRHGFVKALIVSALFFGLMHLNFNQFSYAFALGILLAAVVEVTGSLYSSILIHFCINFRSVRLLYEYSRLEVSDAELEQAGSILQNMSDISSSSIGILVGSSLFILFLVSAAAIAIIVFLVKLLAKLCGREDYMKWVTGGGEKKVLAMREKEKVVDAYFIGACIICVAFMIYQML